MNKLQLICVFLLMLFLLSCGIEDYPVIYPIPQSNITNTLNTRAVVRIPNDIPGTTFTNFAVFYRIYVSDVLLNTTGASTYSVINPALASDYNTFDAYIGNDTIVTANMESIFQGRGYRYLDLQNDNIYNVLSSSVLGTEIVFDFSSSKAPTMSIESDTYILWRNDGGAIFSPQPDRLFINSEELYRNISATINADVQPKSGVTDGRLYTYAAMFILAVGINATSYSNIYSTPALVNVFLLPD